MSFRPRCRTARMPWLACGLAFLALGRDRPALAALGIALIGLAWAPSRAGCRR